MHNSSKASCYTLFKTDANFEDYLDNLSVNERTLLCKFRTTNYRLIIETERWSGTDRVERICNLCNQGLINWLEWCYFNEERNISLDNEQRSNVHEFIKLMNIHDASELKKNDVSSWNILCSFLYSVTFSKALVYSNFSLLSFCFYIYSINITSYDLFVNSHIYMYM